MPVRASDRRAKAASPAGRIRPSARSRSTLATLTALQLLPFRRGVSRCDQASFGRLRRIESIQPKQSASSTSCCQVMLGRPAAFFQPPTKSSGAVAPFASS